MTSGRHFRQGDVTAAIKAVKSAGESVARVEIEPDGTVNVIVGKPEEEIQSDASNKQILERFNNAIRPKKPARSRKGDAS